MESLCGSVGIWSLYVAVKVFVFIVKLENEMTSELVLRFATWELFCHLVFLPFKCLIDTNNPCIILFVKTGTFESSLWALSISSL